MSYAEKSLKAHEQYRGKISMVSKVPLANKDDLSTFYSPGVAQPCLAIQADPSLAYTYTWKNNSVAVVSDGSAVLGLGNIGWLAGLPVMEGKAILFKKFGNIDAVPLVLNTQDPDEIVSIVQAISPTFGWINLEDIAAPACFYIEKKLKETLSIPVFHDDQHGTAIVVLAGLINALKLTGKQFDTIKVVVSGAWAAGIATGLLLQKYGVKHIIMIDSQGSVHKDRSDINSYKQQFVTSNIDNYVGDVHGALQDADVFIGVSKANILDRNDISGMADKPIIFAMANPNPEITPEEAYAWWAFIVATGRSDYPNQVNNVLAFPGLFRGILDAQSSEINDTHKIAAAEALASYITDPRPDYIIPWALEEGVATIVADAVRKIYIK